MCETHDDAYWEARAVIYELLALSFAYPNEMLADAVASGEWAEAAAEAVKALSVDLPDDWGEELDVYSVHAVDHVLPALRVEATRLFVGSPMPAVSPYEGVWRAEEDGVQALLFVNPHTIEVERFMRSCGMGRPEGVNEPLDRVDTELEFLQFLSMMVAGMVESPEGVEPPEGGWNDTYNMFLSKHVLVWLPRFAKRVEAESREPFFRAASVLLAAVLHT